MKKRIWCSLLLFVLTAVFLFSGCGKGDKLKTTEFKGSEDTYSIAIPGEWTEAEAGNPDHLVLENKDQTLVVMVQKFPKELLKAATLDDFIKLYHDNAIPQMAANADVVNQEDVKIEEMVSAKAEEYVVSDEQDTAKAYIAYIQSDENFYAFTITGIAPVYDDSIEDLKSCVPSFQEHKGKKKEEK